MKSVSCDRKTSFQAMTDATLRDAMGKVKDLYDAKDAKIDAVRRSDRSELGGETLEKNEGATQEPVARAKARSMWGFFRHSTQLPFQLSSTRLGNL